MQVADKTQQQTSTVEVPLLVPRVIRTVEDVQSVADELGFIKTSRDKIWKEPAVVKAKATLEDAQRRAAEFSDREKGTLQTVRTTARRFLRGLFKRGGFKTKTLKLTGDRAVSLRKTKGSVAITDNELALAWARENAPEAIVTVETVQTSKLNDEHRRSLLQDPKQAAKDGFGVTQPTENVNWTY